LLLPLLFFRLPKKMEWDAFWSTITTSEDEKEI